MDQLDLSDDIEFDEFPLTKSGEPIAMTQLALKICQMSKTQVFLLIDKQLSTMRLPADISYVD